MDYFHILPVTHNITLLHKSMNVKNRVFTNLTVISAEPFKDAQKRTMSRNNTEEELKINELETF